MRLIQRLRSHRFRGILGVSVAVAVAFAGFRVWKDVLEDRLIAKRWGVVEDGLVYRSGQLSEALVRQMLQEHGIRTVVDFTCGNPKRGADQTAERDAIRALDIESVFLPMKGNGTGDIENYVLAVGKIDQAVKEKRPILVHCAAGSQRTGAAIAYFRLLVQKADPAVVLDEMQQYDFRHRINPDLIPFMNEHMQEMADGLVAAGTVASLPTPLPKLPEGYRYGPISFHSSPDSPR